MGEDITAKEKGLNAVADLIKQRFEYEWQVISILRLLGYEATLHEVPDTLAGLATLKAKSLGQSITWNICLHRFDRRPITETLLKADYQKLQANADPKDTRFWVICNTDFTPDATECAKNLGVRLSVTSQMRLDTIGSQEYIASQLQFAGALLIPGRDSFVVSPAFVARDEAAVWPPRCWIGLQRGLFRQMDALEELEEILNKSDLKERELQVFFETHPELLYRHEFDACWSEPTLRGVGEASSLRPDFVLRPAIGKRLSTRWLVLDLKLPDVRMLRGGRHTGYSHKLTQAIAQLRDYGDFFRDLSNRGKIRELFGYDVLYPRLAVLIGRTSTTDTSALAREHSRHCDVAVIGYDEFIEDTKQILRSRFGIK